MILEFYVKDTGIGIPKDRQEAIFERFVQADIEDKLAWQGSGLGLSISKAFVEMLGGRIWVESEVGKGSTFYFTLPIKIKKDKVDDIETVTKKDRKKALVNKTILIAEDDVTSFEYLDKILSTLGINTLWAENGSKAVIQCRENPLIDLVLMDMNMPVMNGYEATREIKKYRPDLPIIAQTAYAMGGDMKKTIEAGCDDYIAKPIKHDDLLEKIESWICG
ncbi:MAG: response regulator [Bacteroidetes bacterium]|nr:response regulator [Bacteroidota bacterium]